MTTSWSGKRRGSKWRAFLLVSTPAAIALNLSASLMPAAAGENWVETWSASPQDIWSPDFVLPKKVPDRLDGQTVRQIAKVSLGGKQLRVTFSNAFGHSPLHIGAASIALAGDGANLVKGTLNKLTFGGKPGIVIPPGAPAISDPVTLDVPDQARLSISFFLPESTQIETFHWDGKEEGFLAAGDKTAAASLDHAERTDTRILLSDITVKTENAGAVVAFGDSLTDGNGATTGKDRRWPDFLARQLAGKRIAVVNAGISGARLLQDKMGANAAARFSRDVLSVAQARSVVLMLGINDIAWPKSTYDPKASLPDFDALTQGYSQLVALARAHNLKVYGATIPPFEDGLKGSPITGYYSLDKDALRVMLNQWIRSSGTFDAVIDFDALLKDPKHPQRLSPPFDSGDHLHPGDAGNEAMAKLVADQLGTDLEQAHD